MSKLEKTDKFLNWTDGIIGRLEAFFLDRYPIGQMWARALGTSLTSTFMYNTYLEDEMGAVYPSVWFSYIAKSGLGCKSPPLRLLRKWVHQFAPALLAPGKFTPEGMTEYICGRKTKEDEEPMPPHRENFIIRDEVSRMLTERKSHSAYSQLWEYLSDLWDGFVEGVQTRKFGYEGNVDVYTVFLSASSNIFFKKLDEDFFIQGLGNRLLWIIEEPPPPHRIDHSTFFFDMGEKDEKLAQLQAWLRTTLSRLTGKRQAFLVGAGELWANFAYQLDCQIAEKDIIQNKGEFLAKQKLNALKLAMIYAGSRLSIDNFNNLFVGAEDMERAISDTHQYINMWENALVLWREIMGREDEVLRTSKYDLEAMLDVAQRNGGLTTIRELSATLNIPNKHKIMDIVRMGLDKGVFEVAAEMGEQGSLTDAEYQQFKPTRGSSPQVFRVCDGIGK